jgi:hypothetical protein
MKPFLTPHSSVRPPRRMPSPAQSLLPVPARSTVLQTLLLASRRPQDAPGSRNR